MGRRLIYADELLEEFNIETHIHRHGEMWHITEIEAVIGNAPTVGAVEVVRCEKYNHSIPSQWSEHALKCTHWMMDCNKNSFCSYGERRSGEEKQ